MKGFQHFYIFQIQVTSISTMQIREKLRVLNYFLFVLCCVGNWLNLIQTKRPSSSRRRHHRHLYFVVCFIIFDDIMMRWRVVGLVVVSLIDIDVFTDFSKMLCFHKNRKSQQTVHKFLKILALSFSVVHFFRAVLHRFCFRYKYLFTFTNVNIKDILRRTEL